jgi:preprotein translocase subunit SecD
MHNFPAWRLWLVAIVMLLALILALPNVFGESPALQVSRNDRAAIDDAAKASVTGILAAKDIAVAAAHTEGDRLVLRFDDVGRQLAARDAIQQAAPREYLIALSQASRMPGWLRATGLKPMSLGLDLRGGVYFLYEVDVAGAVKQLIASMERDYRTLLRDERIPFTGIQPDGADGVRITLRSGRTSTE